jgi:hypothetical protein
LLEQVDESKLAMAFYLIAQQLVEDRTDTGSARTGDEAGNITGGKVGETDAAGSAE